MSDEQNYQIYAPDKTYIVGLYTVEELEQVLETMKRINRVNEEIMRDTTQLHNEQT
jgi:hypothetical protein